MLKADGKLKSGDEMVAVNEILVVNVTKEYASNVLNNVQDSRKVAGAARLVNIPPV